VIVSSRGVANTPAATGLLHHYHYIGGEDWNVEPSGLVVVWASGQVPLAQVPATQSGSATGGHWTGVTVSNKRFADIRVKS